MGRIKELFAEMSPVVPGSNDAPLTLVRLYEILQGQDLYEDEKFSTEEHHALLECNHPGGFSRCELSCNDEEELFIDGQTVSGHWYSLKRSGFSWVLLDGDFEKSNCFWPCWLLSMGNVEVGEGLQERIEACVEKYARTQGTEGISQKYVGQICWNKIGKLCR